MLTCRITNFRLGANTGVFQLSPQRSALLPRSFNCGNARSQPSLATLGQPLRRRNVPIWLVLFAIPLGLLIDYVLMWFLLLVICAFGLMWVFFFGPLRTIHESFT